MAPAQGVAAGGGHLGLARLERHLFAAADILRGRMDAAEYRGPILALLFLKRCSDVAGDPLARAEAEAAFLVPPEARFEHVQGAVDAELASRVSGALAALEKANPSLQEVLGGFDFTRGEGRARVPPALLRRLVDHFGAVRLRTGDFESPDLPGAAYEFLVEQFAGAAGRKGGEFYTPREVARLMARLLDPVEGMSVYDPCVGSGGMLLACREHVADAGGDPGSLGVAGQDHNVSVWAMCRLNLILHGAREAEIHCEDVLARPMHLRDGAPAHFDRVISNPPFSQNYSRRDMAFPDRFRHGFCPEGGKRGDLMFVQHMLASLVPGGLAATVAPNGVLFRGGAERAIRKGMVEADELEAVLALPPNLFYATGIAACILVLRANAAGGSGKPEGRRGKVLFVDAQEESVPGRAQNRLSHAGAERIAEAFEAFQDRPGFCRVVDRRELAACGFDLTVRRHVEVVEEGAGAAVAGMLEGGIPREEVEARHAHFASAGLDPADLLVPRGDGRHDPAPWLLEAAPGEMGEALREHPRARAALARLEEAFARFWREARGLLAPENGAGVGPPLAQGLRGRLRAGIESCMEAAGGWERAAVRGALAGWWTERRYDLAAVAAGLRGGDPSGALEDLGQDLLRRLREEAVLPLARLAAVLEGWRERYAGSLGDLEEARQRAERAFHEELARLRGGAWGGGA